MPLNRYLDFLAFISAAAVLAADLARVLGFKTLFGSIAFLILKTVHAVPTACPAASSPSLAALAASSPYLQKEQMQPAKLLFSIQYPPFAWVFWSL